MLPVAINWYCYHVSIVQLYLQALIFLLYLVYSRIRKYKIYTNFIFFEIYKLLVDRKFSPLSGYQYERALKWNYCCRDRLETDNWWERWYVSEECTKKKVQNLNTPCPNSLLKILSVKPKISGIVSPQQFKIVIINNLKPNLRSELLHRRSKFVERSYAMVTWDILLTLWSWTDLMSILSDYWRKRSQLYLPADSFRSYCLCILLNLSNLI